MASEIASVKFDLSDIAFGAVICSDCKSVDSLNSAMFTPFTEFSETTSIAKLDSFAMTLAVMASD